VTKNVSASRHHYGRLRGCRYCWQRIWSAIWARPVKRDSKRRTQWIIQKNSVGKITTDSIVDRCVWWKTSFRNQKVSFLKI
jgi:hypothetical protein